MSRGVRAATADVFGEAEALPALSAREDEVSLPARALLLAGEVYVFNIDAGTVFELSVENDGAVAARLTFLAVGSAPDDGAERVARLEAKGFRRVVPGGLQLVETRAAAQGDRLLIAVTAPLFVTIHVFSGAV